MSQRVPALDGVRGLAIAMVIACHYLPQAFDGGRIGVDLFFVLSGYLITAILLAEYDRTGGVSLAGFYSRRIRRLLPALIVLLLVLLLPSLAFDHRRSDLLGLAAAAGYSLNWALAFGLRAPLITHLWSLSAEEQFYLVWPLLLVGLLRLRVSRRWIAAGLAVLLVFALGWRFDLYLHGATWERMNYAADVHSDGLLIGCLAALGADVLTAWAARRPYLSILGFVGVILLTVAVVPFSLFSVGRTVVLPSAAALLSMFLVIGRPRGRFRRIIEHPILQRLGVISYALYLWHLPVFLALRPVMGVWAPLLALPLSYLIAEASGRWIERPFRVHATTTTMVALDGRNVEVVSA